MENHRVKTRMDAFPAGLRVLAVDDDPTWLRILEKMLKKCSFEATACTLATDALDILRKRKDAFDIVISDVNMPDMDGFELLEQVGLEMNLPVIMMSDDGETSRVMKGVLQGACDYLLKPIRMKELQNIWQHVFRKKIHKVKDIEGNEDIQKIKNRLDAFDDSSHSLNGSDNNSARKRKGLEYQMLEDHDTFDSYAKKARVIWSVDLHQKFVDCVNQIGLDKIGPKKILDTMNVPWLTRENVASHLQKHRLYLSRLQNKNEPNSCFGAMKNPESNSKNSPPSFGLQSSIPQINSASCSFEYSGRKMPIQDVGPEVRDKDFISFMPSQQEPRKPVLSDPPHSQKMGTCSRMGHVNSFGSGIVSNQTSFESSIPQQVSWSEEIPVIQFRQQPNEEHKQHRTYTNVRLPSADRHVHADSLKPASSKKRETTIAVIDKADPFEVKALCTEKRSNHDRLAGKIMHKFDSASGKAETSIVDAEVSGAIPTVVNNNGFDQYCASNWHSQPQNHISGSGLNPASFRGDQQLLSLDGSFENAALSNLEFSDYFDSELLTELPSYLYDGVQLNSTF